MGTSSVGFVVAAYALTWLVLVAYAWHLHATLRRARTDFERSGDRAKGEA